MLDKGQAVVWSTTTCPYCVRAKQLLERKGISYEERVIGQGWTRDQLLDAVPTARTVPQVFLNGQLIGGYDRLSEYFSKEEK